MFFHVVLSRVRPQEGAQARFRKMTFLVLILMDSRNRTHRVTGEVPGFGQEAEDRSRGKSRSGQSKHFRVGSKGGPWFPGALA